MVKESVWRVAHRADHGESVVDRAQFREVLRELNARNLGRNWLEDTFDFVRNVFLGIPQIQVAWPTLQVDHDHTFGFVPAGRFASFASLNRLQLHEVR